MKTVRLLSFLIIGSLAPLPALAQDNAQVMQRIDQLENEIQLLQRQVATGAPASGGTAVAPTGNEAANLDVQLSNIQDQMRSLQGQIEENQFQVKKLADTLDKLQKDTDFRFSELAKTAPPAATPSTAPAKEGAKNQEAGEDNETAEEETTTGDGLLHPPQADKNGESKTELNTPRDYYHYAFRLMNQAQYPQAASAFASFIKKYPKDPLVGNAWYWEGETYYIRHDYVTAADDFRQGFEALPDGPKAADNLFKLALSLDAMNRDKDACVVLQQVSLKFKKSVPSLVQRADQEQRRIGCK